MKVCDWYPEQIGRDEPFEVFGYEVGPDTQFATDLARYVGTTNVLTKSLLNSAVDPDDIPPEYSRVWGAAEPIDVWMAVHQILQKRGGSQKLVADPPEIGLPNYTILNVYGNESLRRLIHDDDSPWLTYSLSSLKSTLFYTIRHYTMPPVRLVNPEHPRSLYQKETTRSLSDTGLFEQAWMMGMLRAAKLNLDGMAKAPDVTDQLACTPEAVTAAFEAYQSLSDRDVQALGYEELYGLLTAEIDAFFELYPDAEDAMLS